MYAKGTITKVEKLKITCTSYISETRDVVL